MTEILDVALPRAVFLSPVYSSERGALATLDQRKCESDLEEVGVACGSVKCGTPSSPTKTRDSCPTTQARGTALTESFQIDLEDVFFKCGEMKKLW